MGSARPGCEFACQRSWLAVAVAAVILLSAVSPLDDLSQQQFLRPGGQHVRATIHSFTARYAQHTKLHIATAIPVTVVLVRPVAEVRARSLVSRHLEMAALTGPTTGRGPPPSLSVLAMSQQVLSSSFLTLISC